MNFTEKAITFGCAGDRLFGILSMPSRPMSRGVLIIVGGPQYRAGSHRQFTLLARHLAEQGIPVMRFDYRGMGDSEGDLRSFENIQDDIRTALDVFFGEVSCLREAVIWGLCDAASAGIFYAYHDARVTGLVLLNPWVCTTEGVAKAYLKHYYLRRVMDPELWRKISRGDFKFKAAIKSLAGMVRDTAGEKPLAKTDLPTQGSKCNMAPLPERMLESLQKFHGRILLILSGNDLTAQEFLDMAQASRKWRKLLQSSGVSRHDIKEANHTFSKREWRDRVAQWTGEWVKHG